MVKDPSLEREDVGGDEPMTEPAETDPQTMRERKDRKLEAPDFAPEMEPTR
jgi:hypothetical protein